MPTPNLPLPGTRALVIFARAPESGRVKTRLAAGIGESAALAAYRALTERVIDQLRPLLDTEIVVQYTPRGAEEVMRGWLGDALRYEPQCDGDLGARMVGAITDRLIEGARRVVVVGVDCPDVDSAVIDDAFAALDGADVVFGPATDGGYYLVGVRGPTPEIFEGVPWSTPQTLTAALDRARAADLSVALLAERRDIDTAADWTAWPGSRSPSLSSRL
ncbi:MAG: TIGR04282 family arsenosugar biosynthesis glycosyltransferase [Gemmatimonadaceae bacterium]